MDRKLFNNIFTLSTLFVVFFSTPTMGSVITISNNKLVQNEAEQQALYDVYSGEVISVKEQPGGVIKVVLDVKQDKGIVANLQPGTIVIDAGNPTGGFLKISDLEDGMWLSMIVPANAPFTKSMPPITNSVKVVVIGSEVMGPNIKNHTVKVFDENLISEDNTLKLNIDNKVRIIDIDGRTKGFTADDVKNSQSIVFYSDVTDDIPAVTTPETIMILDNQNTAKPSQSVQSLKLIGLRSEFETLGYEVKWASNDLPVTIEKNGETFAQIMLGETKAQVNGKTIDLGLATSIVSDKIMVSNEIIENLN